MSNAVIVVIVYGAFNIIGGLIGYLKVKSKASLIAGTFAGITLLMSAYGMHQGHSLASFVSIAIAVLLGGRFFQTWKTTKRLMPDMIMILLSLATLAVVGLELIR